MHKRIFIAVCILLFIINGCSGIKNSAGNIGEELVRPVKENADTIGYKLVEGMRESLTNREAEEQFKRLIDSLTNSLGKNANKQSTGLRDSLFNDKIVSWLQNDLLGDNTGARLVHIRNSFFDSYLKDYIRQITSNLGKNILNDSAVSRISAVRDTLIGEKSNMMIKAIVDSAMYAIVNRLNKDINPLLKENLSFIQKNAVMLIVVIGLVTAAILLLVWTRKEKYLKITKMLTYQISELSDKNLKEKLKSDISRNAKTIGIEDELRKLLDKHGLLHSE